MNALARSAFAVAMLWSAARGYAQPSAESPAASHQFTIGQTDFLLDGRRFQIRCGEMHFPRVPRQYWQHRLRMIKAMGLNTVCLYLFWNYHEWNEGRFDWAGQRDAAEFCRLAQNEGLWVVLRPGPYGCAEWEMGGLPWWLLNKADGDFLRTRDPRFIEASRQWLNEVGRVLGPLQVTRGGPILMVQVENEYGFFGKDLDYMRTMRWLVLDAGFNVPLFCCNPTNEVVNSHIPELFSVVNFGSDPARGFKALDEVQKGPRMCGEFYPGWFDTWGTPHKLGHTDAMLADLDYMLRTDGSFSLYMAHGGTTFGMWSGCDRPFRPDTSSYDYDAPISEAGWVTEKFTRIRELMSRYLLPGETIPDPPARNPVIEIPAFSLTQTAPVMENLGDKAIQAKTPRNIEAYNISRGIVVYRATLPAGPAGALQAANVRDFAWVFVDGRQAGIMEARHGRFQVDVPARDRPARIEILLYTLGRVNFGVEVHDRKGVQGPILFTPRGGQSRQVEDWEILPMDFGADAALPPLRWRGQTTSQPAFWHGTFNLARTGDTFLDVSNWGFGLLWVNGHCLGKYWNIGPTQTMYLPAPWLRAGANDVVVLDLLGPERPVLAGVKVPVLDRLRPEKDFFQKNDPGKP
jgi:beta-galactosidase